MRFDFTTNITALNGEPLTENDKPVSFENIIVSCLLGVDQQATADEKYRVYKLASKINASAKDVEIDASDVVLIKKMVAMFTPPLVTGRIWDFLEGNQNG